MFEKHVMPTPPQCTHLVTQVWHRALPSVFLTWVSDAGRFGELQLHGRTPVPCSSCHCHCKHDLIPFTSRQWMPTLMLRTSHITLSALPSKIEYRIMLRDEHCFQLWWFCLTQNTKIISFKQFFRRLKFLFSKWGLLFNSKYLYLKKKVLIKSNNVSEYFC